MTLGTCSYFNQMVLTLASVLWTPVLGHSCGHFPRHTALMALLALAAGAAIVAMVIKRRRRDDLNTVVIRAEGIEVHVSPFGATVTRIVVPDATGARGDVVLGYDRLAGYDDPKDRPYFGAIVGRVANRIARARFTVDGETHTLVANNGPNCLHGGSKGFDRAWWTPEVFEDGTGVRLTHVSNDGDESFPGTVKVAVTYTVRANDRTGTDAALATEMVASANRATPVSLAQHSYFNLAGHDSGLTIGDHRIKLRCSAYTPVDDVMIPTGEVKDVTDTEFDLRGGPGETRDYGVRIGGNMPAGDPEGFDHNFVHDAHVDGDDAVRVLAQVWEPTSGRNMTVASNAPGVQFYTGNWLGAGTRAGKGGARYGKHSGFCLETQHFPDAVNQPEFVSCLLRPGETYRHVMEHRFFV